MINLSNIEISLQEYRESNPGPLGAKQERCLLCNAPHLAPPPLEAFENDVRLSGFFSFYRSLLEKKLGYLLQYDRFSLTIA